MSIIAMIIPSDNSLLVWRIIDENNRTHCIVSSLKFDFHLMGVHLPAFNSEELAPDDILGCQLSCASSAVSTFLHHSLLLSCLWSSLGAGVPLLLP